jgi:membrane protein
VLRLYIRNDGDLLSAGMSYQSLFAGFAGVWTVFSVAGIWVASSQSLLDALVGLLNDAIPHLVGWDGQPGAISELTLHRLSSAFGWTSVIAFASLLATSFGWLVFTRQAVRAMFGLSDHGARGGIRETVIDLALAFAFGAVLIASATVSALSTEVLGDLLHAVGVGSNGLVFNIVARAIGLVIALALNFLTLVALYRLLSHVVIPRHLLVTGALIGAVGLTALGALSGILAVVAARNPLLAGFAVVAGLLLYFNLIGRVVLISAAWISVSMSDEGLDPRERTPEQIEYERALTEHRARIVVAAAEVEKAAGEAATARGLQKPAANRRLRDAHARLQQARAVPEPEPPRRTWRRDLGGD